MSITADERNAQFSEALHLGMKAFYARDMDAAMLHFLDARDAYPNDFPGWHLSNSLVYICQGDIDRALASAKTCRDMIANRRAMFPSETLLALQKLDKVAIKLQAILTAPH